MWLVNKEQFLTIVSKTLRPTVLKQHINKRIYFLERLKNAIANELNS